jgi:hypothetical protein
MDGRTDRHEEDNSHFSQFFESSYQDRIPTPDYCCIRRWQTHCQVLLHHRSAVWDRRSQLSFIHFSSLSHDRSTARFKRALHIVRSIASPFRCEYPLISFRSSISSLCLLPRLHVTSIPLFIFPSVTCRRRQFLHKMWPIQLAFRLLISCRIFLCFLTLSDIS